MDLSLLGRGIVLGFTIAAAVGPIALLTIRRTIANGWLVGMASGMGVATADGLYGAVAAFGLTAISDALVARSRPLGLVGGAALVVLGARTARARPAETIAREGRTRRGIVAAYLSILGLTLTNPMTVILFAAIVVSIGIRPEASNAALLAGGFFLGSAAWWLALVSAVTTLRSRVTGRLLRAVTVASGVLIAAFGAISALAAIRG